jgi:glycosyltransferase involved in cell wall biosynthesis
MSRLKIAFLTSNLLYGGAARSLGYMLESLYSEELEIYVFSRGTGGKLISDKILKYSNGFKVVRINQINCNQAYTTKTGDFKKEIKVSYGWFVEMLKELRIDILHVNTTVFSHVLKQVKEITDIKIVVHLRELILDNDNPSHASFIINQIKAYADALIGISDNEIIPFHEHPLVRIIPNPVDFKEIENTSGTFRREYNIEENNLLIGMFGNFYKTKGQLEFVKALDFLIKNFNLKKINFVIVGVTPRKPLWKRAIKKILRIEDYREIVDNYIEKNELSPYIIKIGSIYNVYEILSDIDIVVRPSLGADPWGRDIIEAMAFRKPVVATGKSEFYIENNVTGFLVPPKKPELLAEKIELLINDPERRLLFGKKGYEKVKSMCDLSLYGRQIKEIYHILK